MIRNTITVIAAFVFTMATGVCNTLSHSLETTDKICGACHTVIGDKTPAGHPDVEGFEEKVYAQTKVIFDDIYEGKFLAASHANSNVTCSSCHGGDMFDIDTEIDNQKCFSCHESYAALAEQTINIVVAEQNPHKSHLGEMDCTVCHHVHSSSLSYCLQCHSNFDMPIPGSSVISSRISEEK